MNYLFDTNIISDLYDISSKHQITRKDGQLFILTPALPKKSPLDIAGISLNLSRDEIVDFVLEGRNKP